MSATEPATQAMPGESTPSAEIVKRSAASPLAMERVPLMTDDEIRRAWRLASSLAASSFYKDARQAEQAFGKILIGRDLGMSPTQAMAGLHIVEGKAEIAAVMMGNFVRSREGYDYRAAWIRETPAARQGERAVREVVYLNEDVASDLRPVVGCAIEFTVDGEKRGVSSFTKEDAQAAGLAGKKNYQGYPRNMYFARAMSNGCKWLVPEVLNGLPVYVEGEIEAEKALGDGQGSGEPAGLDLGPDVETIIAQATEMGHAALSDRGTIEMQLGSQSPAYVASWVRAARKELASIPQDAEVVSGEPDPGDLRRDTVKVGEDKGEADNAAQEPVAASDTSGSPPVVDADRLAAMKRRVDELLNDVDALDDMDPRRAQECRDEAEDLITAIESAGNANQGTML